MINGTVLITGCSSGLGLATAKYFADRGWRVAATSRNVSGLLPWRSEDPQNRAVERLDVTNGESIGEALGAIEARLGEIDVLVNNAGYGLYGPLEGLSDGELSAQLDTHVVGAARVIRRVLPSMRSRRTGTIINVSSIGGRVPAPFMSAYCAAKFALEGLSESLAYELAPHGVRVRIVEPFHFRTHFLEALQLARHAAYDEKLDNHMTWVHQSLASAKDPELAARTIYRSAIDPSSRLRFVTHGRLFLFLRAALPWALWRRFSGMSMQRPATARTRA